MQIIMRQNYNKCEEEIWMKMKGEKNCFKMNKQRGQQSTNKMGLGAEQQRKNEQREDKKSHKVISDITFSGVDWFW